MPPPTHTHSFAVITLGNCNVRATGDATSNVPGLNPGANNVGMYNGEENTESCLVTFDLCVVLEY